MIIRKGDHYFVAKILELADSGIPIWEGTGSTSLSGED
jgi:hypothetical protein